MQNKANKGYRTETLQRKTPKILTPNPQLFVKPDPPKKARKRKYLPTTRHTSIPKLDIQTSYPRPKQLDIKSSSAFSISPQAL